MVAEAFVVSVGLRTLDVSRFKLDASRFKFDGSFFNVDFSRFIFDGVRLRLEDSRLRLDVSRLVIDELFLAPVAAPVDISFFGSVGVFFAVTLSPVVLRWFVVFRIDARS